MDHPWKDHFETLLWCDLEHKPTNIKGSCIKANDSQALDVCKTITQRLLRLKSSINITEEKKDQAYYDRWELANWKLLRWTCLDLHPYLCVGWTWRLACGLLSHHTHDEHVRNLRTMGFTTTHPFTKFNSIIKLKKLEEAEHKLTRWGTFTWPGTCSTRKVRNPPRACYARLPLSS